MSHKAILAIRGQNRETADFRWFANPADGEGAIVNFAFMAQAPDSTAPEAETFSPYNTQERAVVLDALKYLSSIANIKFVETATENAFLKFGQTGIAGSSTGYAYSINYDKALKQYEGGEVWLDTALSYSSTGNAHRTARHEILHTLGLEHPFDGTYRLTGKELDSSIMGYTYEGPNNKVGVFDMMALQSIYGPAQARLGANTYKFGKDKLIWDGGGTDTIDASAAKAKIVLDLNDGTWNYIGKKASSLLAANQVYIGEFSVIENAKGSKYADKILGNEVRNTLKGGSGNDSLDGRTGDDRLSGDAGNDVLTGGSGLDYLSGGAGNDILRGGVEADRLYGGSGKDKFKFSSYADLGDLTSHDTVFDFRKDDDIDLRSFDADPAAGGRQKLTFLGNSTGDWKLSAQKAGQFYYNTTTDKLVIDATGDGVADHYIGVKGVTSMKADYFLL
jgi:hypothetical protein